jgi:sugar/nucleoside kinase (ribokinase family)
MANPSFDAVVAGHVCLDVIPRFHDTGAKTMGEIMVPGKLVNVAAATLSTGGPVSNTGLALIKLGVKVLLMGKVGDDLFGSAIRQRFAEWGPEAAGAMHVVSGEETSYTIVLAPPNIDRIFLHNPGANDTFCSADIDYDLVAKARLFHLGYPPLMRALYQHRGGELIGIYRRVKELGVTTSIDMSLPDPSSESGRVDWKAVLETLLPHVDIAPLSAEESMFMLDRPRFDELKRLAGQDEPLAAFTPADFVWIGRELLKLGARVVLVKCGRRGMLLFTDTVERIAGMGAAAPADPRAWANRGLWEEAFHVDRVASATGSGDSSIAGFLSAFLRGCGPEQAIETGCCAGGQNVQVFDAISGIHTWDETQAMTASWPKRRQQADGDWSYCEAARVWRHFQDAKVHG